jgi:hypothetical protein
VTPLRFTGFAQIIPSDANRSTGWARIDLKLFARRYDFVEKGALRCSDKCAGWGCGRDLCPGSTAMVEGVAQGQRDPIDERGCNDLVRWTASFENGASCDFSGCIPNSRRPGPASFRGASVRRIAAMDLVAVCRDATGASLSSAYIGLVGAGGRPQVIPPVLDPGGGVD